MKVAELLEGVSVERIIGDKNTEIRQLYCDSGAVEAGGLYFALKGSKADGHDYCGFAQSKGAVCVVCEHETPVTVTQIIVPDSRAAMAQISANFYGNPSKKLKLIGVTGTNGKTTTTFLIKSIAEAAGYGAAALGTEGCYINDRFLPTILTTPDPIELNKMLSLMVESSVRFAAMEVSAHALALNKIEGVRFEAGIFTNLTQDHLDFFGNMENYKQAKKSFFQSSHCAVAIVNNDDSCGREIYAQKKIPSYGYGIYNPAEMFAIDIRYGCGISYTANIRDDIMQIESALYGKFNVYNTLAAASACSLCGIGREAIVKGIKNLKTVKGRFNVINVKGFKVIIDYAHTPDGIKNVLIAARELCAARLICVFGCGGNRDKSKRPIMGNIASELSDFCVITSDNPRFEDPVEIIREIEKGVIGGYICIENRKRAITYALTIAKEGDVIAILGKGAEQYQEIAGVRYPYNDYDTVKEILHI